MMKNTTSLLLAASWAISISGSLFAADFTWNTADGTWDTTTANWTGDGSTWVNATDSHASFSNTGATVTLGEAITAGTLTFNTTGHTLDTAGNNLSATLLAGTGAFTKTGSGILSLTGASTHSGGIAINGGVISLAGAANFSGTTGDISIGSSGTLQFTTASGSRTLTRSIDGTGTLHVGFTGSTAITTLNAENTLGGFNGTLQIGGIGEIGTGFIRLQTAGLGAEASVVVSNGGQFWNTTSGATYSNNFTITGIGGSEGLGAIRADSATTYSGTITIAGSARISGINNSGVSTFSGKITGGNLELGGGGTNSSTHWTGYALTNNANDHASTTITRGIVLAGGNTVFGAGTLTHAGGTLASDSTTARTLANAYVVAGNVVLGDATRNGKLTFTGPVNLTATRTITTQSEVEISGLLTTTGDLIHAGAADLTLSGGGIVNVAQQAGTGVLNIDGTWTNASLRTGGGGAGTAIINLRGNVTREGDAIISQNTANHTGILNVTGTYRQISGSLFFGNNVATAIGILNINAGGRVIFESTMDVVSLGRDRATGIFNLNSGGVLETGKALQDSNNLNNADSKSFVNFDGGTLKALADLDDVFWKSKTLSSYTVTVKAGGAVIDTNGFDVGVTRTLAGDTESLGGGLTKKGEGTLTLSAANTYTGATVVENGALVLASTGSIATSSGIHLATGSSVFNTQAFANYTIDTDQTLSGNGIVITGGTLTVAGTLAPGNSTGTLFVAGDVVLQEGATLLFEIGTGGAHDTLNFILPGSTLTLEGDVTLILALAEDALEQSYTLFGGSGLTINGPGSFNVSFDGIEPTYWDWNPYSGTLTIIPEPSTYALWSAISVAGLTVLRRRKKK